MFLSLKLYIFDKSDSVFLVRFYAGPAKVLKIPHRSSASPRFLWGIKNEIFDDITFVKKITDQSEFLKKVGILERANILSKKMTFKTKADMYYRLKRLLDSRQMGSLFKVILAQKKDRNFSLGF